MLLQKRFSVKTDGRGTYEITKIINDFISERGVEKGLCFVFLRHTSASLIFCENADPVVREDLERFIKLLIPDDTSLFKHTAEGEDDMPAHIRTVLTQNHLSVPITEGELALGTWQGIFVWEHRYQPHERQVVITLLNDVL